MRFSIMVPVALALAFAGCGSKQNTKSDTSANNTTTAGKRNKGKQTVSAKGDLRDALMHLRRVHFGLDSDTLLPDSRTALEQAAQVLRLYPKVEIYIDGHTDSRGTTEYNVALGERRAQVVLDYLTKLGIPSSRLHVVSFGKEQPMASGGNQLSHGKNRRAEFRLYRGDAQIVLEEGVVYNDKGQRL